VGVIDVENGLLRQFMSRNGHMTSDAPTTAGLVYDLLPDAGFDRHVHDEHQLTWATQGVLLVGTGDETWALPPSHALWIPAGVPHSVVAVSRTRMLSLWVTPQRCPVTWAVPTLVGVHGLAGQLVAHLLALDRDKARRELAEALLWDVLQPVPVMPLITTMPTDKRARRVAEGLRADVTDNRTLAQWGRIVGASARTLSRLFVAETGMSFGRWRTTARLAASLPLLAGGASVSTVARRTGYATASAYVAAFHREVGTAPAHYFGLR
jgi:AraC-like DNA-binding protein/quercetin dioxygenase-like cupin family protein